MKHIRIISPSGVIEPEHITLATQRLERWGFRVSIGQHAFDACGRFAGNAADRLSDLNDAFADPSIDIILCSRGGYGMQQIIDKVILPTRPKAEWPLVVGFSDITVLHALMSVHGVPSLHASMCKALATLPDDSATLLLLRDALKSGKINRLSGMEGRKVIGGNLSLLYALQGTPYSLDAIIDVCEEPPVLLLEDIGERHYHIDRMMQNLRMSGVLSRVGGVIVGQFTDCEDDALMGCTVQETIASLLAEYNYPIVWNAPYGHIDENIPIFLS